MYCKMVKIISPSSHIVTNVFFSVMRTFKIYSLSNFQIYNSVLTIVTILFILFPELLFVPFDYFHSFTHSQVLSMLSQMVGLCYFSCLNNTIYLMLLYITFSHLFIHQWILRGCCHVLEIVNNAVMNEGI